MEKCGDGSIEKHHIVPRCMGGTNDKSNLVNLTCEEHRLAHLLLWKISPDIDELAMAFLKMESISPNHKRKNTKKSLMYRIVRQQFTLWIKAHKSRYVEYNGEIHTIREWAEIRGIPYKSFRILFYRKKNHNPLTKEDLDDIMHHEMVSKKTHEYKGIMYSTKELSELLNISYYVLKRGFRYGRSIEEIIELSKSGHFYPDVMEEIGGKYTYNGETGTIYYFS